MLGSGVAYILNFHVVNHAPATVASSVTYLIPLFAIIVGTAFLHEPVTWYEPVGGLLILAGAAISQDRFHRRRGESPEPVAHTTRRSVTGHHPGGPASGA